jgi:hypothetical protein
MMFLQDDMNRRAPHTAVSAAAAEAMAARAVVSMTPALPGITLLLPGTGMLPLPARRDR